MCHKPYRDLQLLPIFTHQWKDLSIDFVIGLPISADWKGDSYDSILVIVYRLTKMVHYESVKVTINAAGLAEVIIDMVMRHHWVLKSIVTDRGLLFISIFWFSLCYFLRIKKRLSTVFHPKTDSQIERQNSKMEAYLRAFINLEQDNWGRLFPIAEFAYNKAKITSTGHTPFKLNNDYHLRVSFKEDVDPHSTYRFANKLAEELRKLIEVCCQNLFHTQEL